MSLKRDGRGNPYSETQNVRITALPQIYSGDPGLSIRAYIGLGQRLHRGAEIPMRNKKDAYDFIRSLILAIEQLSYDD